MVNLLQIFSSASKSISSCSIDSVAKIISENKISDFLPLSNIGVHLDIVEQENAAEKYNLKPIYGRTLEFSSAINNLCLAPVLIYAKNLNGRDWLYQQPSEFNNEGQFLKSIKSAPKNSILIFIPTEWFYDNKLELIANEIKAEHIEYTFQSLKSHIDKDLEHLSSWRKVYHTPVFSNNLKYDTGTIQDLTYNAERGQHNSLFLSVEEAVYLSSSEKRYLLVDRANNSVPLSKFNTITGNKGVFVDDLFSICDYIPPVEKLVELSRIGAESVTLDTVFNSLNCVSIRCFLELKMSAFLTKNSHLTDSEIKKYESRFKHELKLVEKNNLVVELLNILNIASWLENKMNNWSTLSLGANPLILFISGLGIIDPIKNNISADITFAIFKTLSLKINFSSYKDKESAFKMIKNRSEYPLIRNSFLHRFEFESDRKGGPKQIKRTKAIACNPDKFSSTDSLFSLNMPHFRIAPKTESDRIGLSTEELNKLGFWTCSFHKLEFIGVINDFSSNLNLESKSPLDLNDIKYDSPEVFAFLRDGDFHNLNLPLAINRTSAQDKMIESIKSLHDVAHLLSDVELRKHSFFERIDSEITPYDDINEILSKTDYSLIYIEQFFEIMTKCFGLGLVKAAKLFYRVQDGEQLTPLDITNENGDFEALAKAEWISKKATVKLVSMSNKLSEAHLTCLSAYLMMHHKALFSSCVVHRSLRTQASLADVFKIVSVEMELFEAYSGESKYY